MALALKMGKQVISLMRRCRIDRGIKIKDRYI